MKDGGGLGGGAARLVVPVGHALAGVGGCQVGAVAEVVGQHGGGLVDQGDGARGVGCGGAAAGGHLDGALHTGGWGELGEVGEHVASVKAVPVEVERGAAQYVGRGRVEPGRFLGRVHGVH